jgi:trimethylguanosine synthase
VDELAQLARPLDASYVENGKKRDREWVEIEEEWVGDKLKAITAYYGGLIAE